MRYLLADEAETPVLSDALVGLPQHRVKGLVVVSKCCSGVARNSKGSNVNLQNKKHESALYCSGYKTEGLVDVSSFMKAKRTAALSDLSVLDQLHPYRVSL